MFRLAIVALILTFTLIAAGSDEASAGGLTFVVQVQSNIGDNNLADDNCDVDPGSEGDQCTLRAAIQESNDEPGPDAIHFNLSGLIAVIVSAPLPSITETVVIDGTTQPNCPDPPCVTLDGISTTNEDGLDIEADNVTIRGLAIYQFDLHGIHIHPGADGNTIAGNHLGTDAAGMTDLGNGGAGVLISNSSNNVIGGNSDDDRNVISGNLTGVNIQVVTAGGGNVVPGNYIGVGADGQTALPNSSGVVVRNIISGGRVLPGSSSTGVVPAGILEPNVIGPDNVISGNVNNGVCICEANGVVVIGNRIGTDANGQTAVPNGLYGIDTRGNDNAIGGATQASRNIISGNGQNGIHVMPVDQADAVGNVISGNYIGTNAAGTGAIPNGQTGVQLQNTEDTVVGGETAAARNVISGNGNSGIVVTGNLGHVDITGNYIGATASGEGALGNGFTAIQVVGPLNDLDIRNNVISGNSNTGVALGAGTQDVNIMANRIGVTPSGAALGNANHGVFIRDSSGHQVGSVGAGANIIANNGGNGVMVTTDGGVATGNTIRGNSIHTNVLKGIETAAGGNNELAPPVIDPPGGGTEITGTACPNCTVDVYSDDVDEGRIFEGSTVADGGGAWSFNELVSGPFTTATATDGGGNTSEFSVPITSPQPPTPTPTPSATPTPTPTGSPLATASPTPTPTATATPGPTETPLPSITLRGREIDWGDDDCSGDADPIDALLTLRFDAGLGRPEEPACPWIGHPVNVADASTHTWGDVDCSDELTGAINPVDALKILRFDAGLEVDQPTDCPEMGEVRLVEWA